MMKRPVFWAIRSLIVSFLVILHYVSCDDDQSVSRDIVYFKEHLSAGMDHQSIIRYFGEAEKDLGSGIHIYQYNLGDGTFVIIGCTDKLLYAKRVDQQHNILETLV